MARLNPTNISKNGSTGSIKLSGLNVINSQDFILNLLAVSTSASRTIPLELMVRNDSIDPVQLLLPLDQTTQVSRTILLSWAKDINVNSYRLELSKSEDFEDIILTKNTSLTSFTLNDLDFATDFYWRVKSINPCEESNFTTNKFSTIIVNCNTYTADDLPQRIKDSNNLSGVTNVDLNIIDMAIIEDLNVHVSIDHSYIGDISIKLLTPDNKLIKLSQNLGDKLKDYTNTVFDQEAEDPIVFAIPPFTGSYRPFESLSSLRGKNLNGRWRLIIEDNFEGVSGFLKEFSIAACYKGEVLSDSDLDMIADIDDNCPNIANTDQLDSDGNGIGDICDINSQGNFTISKKDVTCIGKRNGEITINATAQFSYNLSFIGSNGQKAESSFSAQNEIMIGNIPVGDYSVCITAIEDPNFERCFITTIEAPDPLSVQTKLNPAKKSVSVILEGASKYNLKINNQLYSLSSGRHDFSLQEGLSLIEVTTDLSCQGSIKREVYISDQSSLYPNPARDFVNVLVGGKENQVKIILYKTDGTLLNETDLQLSEWERAYQIPLDGQASGLYFIVIKKGSASENLKLLKL
jgi:subtilisin-like proprotein convertase family protein